MKIQKKKAKEFLALTFLGAIFSLTITSCITGEAKMKAAETDLVAQAEMLISVKTPENRIEKEPLIMVHYMPWYQAPPTSNNYGWHWHMGHFEPYLSNDNGLPQIASHFMPLTGPYDSSDPLILEYQILLMQISGVDGIIIDWYGIKDALDYDSIHQSSQLVFSEIQRAKMKFAVCYEDQTITNMIQGNQLEYEDAVSHASEVLNWMEENWFHDEAYLKINNQPLLMNFGPQFFMQETQWDTIFSGTDPRPLFVTLDDHLENYADGVYAWPPMYKSVRGELSLLDTIGYLNNFYSKNEDSDFLVTTAFPGFKDIYEEAGVGNSYGYLNSYNGETFRLSLKAAIAARPDVIQIATWNDYGEGTIVEPSLQTGYLYLKQLQNLQKQGNPDFIFNQEDLEMPIKFYILRRDNPQDSNIQSKLDALYLAVIEKDIEEFNRLKSELGI